MYVGTAFWKDLNLLERFHSYLLENVMIPYFTRAIYPLQNASRHMISSYQHIFAWKWVLEPPFWDEEHNKGKFQSTYPRSHSYWVAELQLDPKSPRQTWPKETWYQTVLFTLGRASPSHFLCFSLVLKSVLKRSSPLLKNSWLSCLVNSPYPWNREKSFEKTKSPKMRIW